MLHKPPKIVSKALRNSADGEICTLRVEGCRHNEGVVLCHLNTRWKGWANKSPDIFAVYGCWKCHQKLDSGEVSKEDQLRAMQESLIKMYQKGLIIIN